MYRMMSGYGHGMSGSNQHRLLKTLPILPVEVGGQPVLDAVGGRQEPQHAGRVGTRGNFSGRFIPDGQRAGGKFNEVFGFRMSEIPLLFRKADFSKRLPDALPASHAGGDEICISQSITLQRSSKIRIVPPNYQQHNSPAI